MRRVALVCLLTLGLGGAAWAEPPPEGQCPLLGGGPGAESGDTGLQLREGMLLGLNDLMALRSLLPAEVWSWREYFFFEGMALELGPCHRRYPVATAYTAAGLRHWEKVRLDDDGNLRDYVAGLPFPTDRIDPEDPQAGLKWVWNLEQRYRGAGPAGQFKITDMPSRIGGIEVYKGEFFQLKTRHRADLPPEYAVPEANEHIWVGGGRFDEPFHARHLAWRQMRPERTQTRWKESDRVWVYVPDMRKPRRAMTSWVDGFYTPRYSAAQQIAAGGGVPFSRGGASAGDDYGAGGISGMTTINPTSAVSAAATAHLRRGFVGISIRPNAYRWKYRGERDVIAPLNGIIPGWPMDDTRNFGPTGLSLASDRWDVRRAVVVEGIALRPEASLARVTLYIDFQTQQPLFYIARRKNGLMVDVGILVHRFSGDLPDYPTWPNGQRALVFDPVATSFFAIADGGTGWRRESYDVQSIPHAEEDRRRMTSVAELEHGH
jgi:hypothetical protein